MFLIYNLLSEGRGHARMHASIYLGVRTLHGVCMCVHVAIRRQGAEMVLSFHRVGSQNLIQLPGSVALFFFFF